MATIAEINSGANYLGNNNLGGGNDGVISIDTKPLDNLAYYTMVANKVKYEQRQKDTEAKAKELAQVTAYDLSTAIPKDSQIIRDKYNEFYKWVQDNPTVLDYKNNEKGWLEYNKRKNDFANDLINAKSRNITYKAGIAEYEKETNPLLKAEMKRRLDEQIQDGDLNKTIVLQQYSPTVHTVPTPQTQSFDVGIIDEKGNFMADRQVKVVSMKDVNSKASAVALGMLGDVLDENSAEFKLLSPEAQQQKREAFKTNKAGGSLLVVDQAKAYNDVLSDPLYKNADGTLNIDKIKSSNQILAGVMKSFDDYNNYVNGIKEQIKAGAYKDKTGKALQFGIDNLDEYDYQPISYLDGNVTPEELLKVQILAKALPDTYETKITQTNIATDNAKIAQGWKKLNLDEKELRLKEQQFRASQKGSETQVNGAMERAKRIFGDLQKLADNSGVISPEKVRQLNAEQLKYLGIEVPQERNAEGQIINSGGFKPLDLSGKEYAIKLDGNGNITVLAPDENNKNSKKGTKLEYRDGTYFGKFDNTKSTNIWNVGTNILNEELKNAGSKELNTYWGVDVTGGNTSFTNSKTSTTQASSATLKTNYKVGNKDYTKEQLNQMGYSDEQIQEAVRLGNIK